MIIDCIADLHGHYPELEGGDLLIVAGDLTAKDTPENHQKFGEWLYNHGTNYKKAIIVAGNHDNFCQTYNEEMKSWGLGYLCDSGTEFEGLKIWGSPWTKSFVGMNPNCKAFTVDTEEELQDKWKLIPDDIDILVTHIPPYGILDEIDSQEHCTSYSVGSKSLLKRVCEIKPRLHIFGHVHEGYGEFLAEWRQPNTQFINASFVNEYYEPVNKPIKVIL